MDQILVTIFVLISTEFLEIFPPCSQIARNKGEIFQDPAFPYNLQWKNPRISESPETRGKYFKDRLIGAEFAPDMT